VTKKKGPSKGTAWYSVKESKDRVKGGKKKACPDKGKKRNPAGNKRKRGQRVSSTDEEKKFKTVSIKVIALLRNFLILKTPLT